MKVYNPYTGWQLIQESKKHITCEDIDLSDYVLVKLPHFLSKITKVTAFDCRNNRLTSLKNCPMYIRDWFVCANNKLTTLEGGPKKVGSVGGYSNYDCSNNRLTTLKGCPSVLFIFSCNDNNLTSVDDGPKKVTDYNCYSNAKEFTREEIRKYCKVDRTILFY